METEQSVRPPDQYLDLLERPLFAHFATVARDGSPRVNPMWFLWDNAAGVLKLTHTNQRHNYRNLRKNPRVAFSIADPDNQYRYLQLRGEVVNVEPDPTGAFYSTLQQRYRGHTSEVRDKDVRVMITIRPTAFKVRGMSRFTVLYTDRGDYSHDFSIEQPIYAAIDAEIVDARLDHNAIDWDRYSRLLAEADALVCFRMPVDRRALEAAPKLKVAVRAGVGYENFDLGAFAQRGIPACNVPDYGSEEVALHALSMLLALRRRVVFFDRTLRDGYWRGAPGSREMWRLSNQTAGVIGLGRIGTAFARRARALFGAVLACDPYVPADAFAAAGVESVQLDDLLRRADNITLHVPLTTRTRHLIGARELALMRPTSVVVNTSRGGVMDQLALAEALKAGAIEGAACDVWEHEPATLDHPLFSCENFIGSPHVAGLSVEGENDNRTKQAQEVARVLSGEPPRNPVVAED